MLSEPEGHGSGGDDPSHNNVDMMHIVNTVISCLRMNTSINGICVSCTGLALMDRMFSELAGEEFETAEMVLGRMTVHLREARQQIKLKEMKLKEENKNGR